MAENLHDFLAFHHLFNVSVHRPRSFCCRAKYFPLLPLKFLRRKQHNSYHNNSDSRQRNIPDHYADEHTLTIVIALFSTCGILWLII